MKTPVSASRPRSAIIPTHAAMETLYPSTWKSKIAPTAENGTASITMLDLKTERVFMYKSTKMSRIRNGNDELERLLHSLHVLVLPTEAQ
ncbi:MAG: hypothetical protein QM784_28465 [Polyangiaceae bacterium]